MFGRLERRRRGGGDDVGMGGRKWWGQGDVINGTTTIPQMEIRETRAFLSRLMVKTSSKRLFISDDVTITVISISQSSFYACSE